MKNKQQHSSKDAEIKTKNRKQKKYLQKHGKNLKFIVVLLCFSFFAWLFLF